MSVTIKRLEKALLSPRNGNLTQLDRKLQIQ